MATLLNSQSLLELQSLLGDDLFDITGLFAQQVRLELAQAQTLAAHADWPALARAAHAIKGSTGNMGALVLSDWAAKLEKAALVGHAETVGLALSALTERVEPTLAAMHEEGFLRD